MTSPVTQSTLQALIANLGRYLANLARAGQKRKEESRKALQGVIRATRQTRVYVRELDATDVAEWLVTDDVKPETIALLKSTGLPVWSTKLETHDGPGNRRMESRVRHERL